MHCITSFDRHFYSKLHTGVDQSTWSGTVPGAIGLKVLAQRPYCNIITLPAIGYEHTIFWTWVQIPEIYTPVLL